VPVRPQAYLKSRSDRQHVGQFLILDLTITALPCRLKSSATLCQSLCPCWKRLLSNISSLIDGVCVVMWITLADDIHRYLNIRACHWITELRSFTLKSHSRLYKRRFVSAALRTN